LVSDTRILIAHQGTIPSYRIPFYTLLEKQRPDHWSFQVVCSNNEIHYPFPTVHAPLRPLPFNLQWQNLRATARQADVLILDTHLRNLGYLLAPSSRKKLGSLILWGHTHNMNKQPGGPVARISRRMKATWLRSSDMFFAYTASQARTARALGLTQSKIQVLNNTVDLETHRSRYLRLAPDRNSIRKTLGFNPEDKVLLLVGRLLPEKRIRFLCETFRKLATDKTFRLVVIGDGPETALIRELQAAYPMQIVAPGVITNTDDLSRYYVSGDAFIMPGTIGLAPLEAICYDLPVIGIELSTHGPEYDYFTATNSYILSASTTPAQFAAYLNRCMTQPGFRVSLPDAFASISHLRLENMVENFITGINRVLSLQNR